MEKVKAPNLAQVPENVGVHFGFVKAEADVKKMVEEGTFNSGGVLTNIHKGLF